MSDLLTLGGVQYQPQTLETTISVPSTLQVIQSITGSGYLSKAIVYMSNNNQQLRVTVDGVVVAWLSSDSNRTCGIILEDYLVGNNGSLVYRQPDNSYSTNEPGPGSVVSYPQSNPISPNGSWMYLPSPIIYKQSLKIEAQSTSSATALQVSILGGTKI